MSDNRGQLQLGVLGFADKPGLVCELIGDGNYDSAIYQRWFVLRDGWFHPAGPPSGLNLDSDSSPSSQPNIGFITVALQKGSLVGHHTEQLDAVTNSADMDQFASIAAELAPTRINIGARATGQQLKQPLVSS